MKSNILNVAVLSTALVAGTFGVGLPAFAAIGVPTGAMVSICSNPDAAPGACAAATQAVIAALKALGLSADELDAQLGEVAYVLYTAALESGNAAVATEVAAAISAVAAEVADPTQAALISVAASTVESAAAGGEATDFGPILASDN